VWCSWWNHFASQFYYIPLRLCYPISLLWERSILWSIGLCTKCMAVQLLKTLITPETLLTCDVWKILCISVNQNLGKVYVFHLLIILGKCVYTVCLDSDARSSLFQDAAIINTMYSTQSLYVFVCLFSSWCLYCFVYAALVWNKDIYYNILRNEPFHDNLFSHGDR